MCLCTCKFSAQFGPILLQVKPNMIFHSFAIPFSLFICILFSNLITVVDNPNSWFTRSFFHESAKKCRIICNKIHAFAISKAMSPKIHVFCEIFLCVIYLPYNATSIINSASTASQKLTSVLQLSQDNLQTSSPFLKEHTFNYSFVLRCLIVHFARIRKKLRETKIRSHMYILFVRCNDIFVSDFLTSFYCCFYRFRFPYCSLLFHLYRQF